MPARSTLPRRALVGSAWATPVVLVGAAAPAFAASTRSITAAFATQRVSNGVTFTGTVTNNGPTAAVVTLSIRVDVSSPPAAIITGGIPSTVAGWTQTYFGYTPGSTNQKSATWTSRTTVALAAGASIALPRPTLLVNLASAAGTTQVTLSAPAPATVVQPAPQAFAAWAGAAPLGRSAAPRGFGAPE